MTDPMIFVVGAVCLVVGAALVYVLGRRQERLQAP